MSKHGGRANGPGDKQRSGEQEPLTAAAAALDEAMKSFERLTDSATRPVLNTEKNMDQVARAIQEAAQSHQEFGTQLKALIEAVGAARDRQAKSAEALNARAEELRARREEFEALRNQFAALGEQAKQVNAMVFALASNKGAKSAEGPELDGVLGALGEALERLAGVVEQARGLSEQARERNMADIQREADSLRQQTQSAHHKLDQLRQGLAARRGG